MPADKDVAFPIIGSLAQSAFDTAMKAIWNFCGQLLTTVFGIIDRFAAPDVDPVNGPLRGVIPTVLWVAGLVAVLLAFVQIARGAITRGRGVAKLLIGLGQYAIVNAAGYAVLATAVTACTALTKAILHSALHVDSWSGINQANSTLLGTSQSVSAVALGVIGMVCVGPAAVGYLVMALVRDAAVLVLAATMPILASGLLSETTSAWFWKGLRWTTALLLIQPATALVIGIGFNIAASSSGAGSPAGGEPVAGLGNLVVGGLTLLISLLCPLALFKLLAFVEPGTPSGQALRMSMARGSLPATGKGASGAGAGSSGAGSSAAAEGATSSRFGAVASKAHPAVAAAVLGAQKLHQVGQRTLAQADNVLSTAGVGSHASPQPVVMRASNGTSTGSASTGSRRTQEPARPESQSPSTPPATPPVHVGHGQVPMAPSAPTTPSPSSRSSQPPTPTKEDADR